MWAKLFADSGGGVNVARFVSTAPEDSLLVAGEFSSEWVDFGSGPMTSQGASDAFIARYSIDGELMWARGIGGGGADAALACRPDADGNTFVTGYIQSTAVTAGPVVLDGPGGFLIKLGPDGTPLWGHSFGNTTSDVGRSILVSEDGSVLLALDLAADNLEACGHNYSSAGATDVLLVKLDGDGDCIWAASFGGEGVETANSLFAAVSGRALMTGAFSSQTLKIGDSVFSSQGNKDLFVTAFAP